MHIDAPFVPGPGWTMTMLSDTLPALKGTDGDTRVYTYDSGKPGGTFIVLGGTHPQEIAGVLAADLLIENTKGHPGQANRAARGQPSGIHRHGPDGSLRPRHYAHRQGRQPALVPGRQPSRQPGRPVAGPG